MGLPSFSMKRPVLTVMIFSAVVLSGVIALLSLPLELYQGQNQGIISIIVRARGGLPPIEVEKSITKPIEERVATVTNIKKLYSTSREAEARVTMEFEPGTNMDFAALEVREKFSRVKPLLPKEIEKPVIANYDDTKAAVLIFALTSESMSPEEVRDLVEAELNPILSRVDGVASVEVYGGRERKILVELDRDKMVAYNISVEKVMDILGQSNINLLAGNVDAGSLEFAIRSMGAFQTVEEISEIGIKATRQGSIIPLKEIATVKDAYMEANDYARLNLENNVQVYVKKTSASKTIPVVKTLRQYVDEFEDYYKDKLDIVTVQDKAEVIERAISDVLNALLVGMILAVLVIYIFLRQSILALIVLVSIPTSVVATFVFMAGQGISINVMTLSGLALSIGILVDSSVVILENVFSKKERGLEDQDAIREGAEEVWLPLLASLATNLIVFLPLIFIDKRIQLRYWGFAATVCFSLAASFFVAQMLLPVLLDKWGQGRIQPHISETQNLIWAKVRYTYEWLMRWNLKLRYWLVGGCVILCLFAMYSLSQKSMDWPNTLEENEFSIIVFPLAGAKLEANDEAVNRLEDMLDKIPDVEMFSSTVRKDDVKVFVRLIPKVKRTYSKEEIIEIIDEKGNEMIKEIHDDYSLIVDEGAGTSDQKKLVINIFGLENDKLEKLARKFAGKMQEVDGLQNLVMTDLRRRPEYALVVDKGRAAAYELTVREVADSIHAQIRGMRPTKFHELSKGQEIETITRLQAIYRQKIDDLKQIYIQNHKGVQIPLGEIANFYPTTGPQTIDRQDKYRYVFVKGDTKKPIEELAKNVEMAVADVPLPDEYYWRFGGSYGTLMKGKSDLMIAFLITLFLVYAILACLYQSYVQPLLIMVSVAMASIGIAVALSFGDRPLSEQVIIGIILLAGYVVNPAIIMVDHMNHLKSQGMSKEEVLTQAGLDRLRPILMTTFSTCFGFLPMALSWGQSSDLWSPLAVTVIGGLISSTLLTLFILPNLILISQDIKRAVYSFLNVRRAT